jgi:hypothetical protein
LETDIEKAREEGNWKKVIELATQLKDKGERGGHFSPSFVAVLWIPDPLWILISLGQWIRGRRQKQRNLRFERSSLWMVGGFSWSLEVLH